MRSTALLLFLLLSAPVAAEAPAPAAGPDAPAPPPSTPAPGPPVPAELPPPAPASSAAPATPPPAALPPPARQEPFQRRPLVTKVDKRWFGQGVCYGPHRDGQRPGGPAPSRPQLRQDLKLLAGRFTLLRLSSTDEAAELLVSLISEDELPFKVLLGASIERETPTPDAPGTPRPEAAAANQAQVEAALKLASAYPDVVLALVVASPPQGSGSSRRLPQETLVSWLRRARAGSKVPVSTAGDAAFWLSPEGVQLAREVDFLVLHASALWSGKQVQEALVFTQARYADVSRRHFGLPVVLGEAGWATSRHAGEEAERIQGETGEGPQQVFFDQLTRWVVGQRITSAWFQAFDEPWRGGADADELAKHWGLWRADRTPKAAVEKTPTVAPGGL